MYFSNLADLVIKLADMSEHKKYGQVTLFLGPDNPINACFLRLVKPKEMPKEIRDALSLVVNHFKSRKLEIVCDDSLTVQKVMSLEMEA